MAPPSMIIITPLSLLLSQTVSCFSFGFGFGAGSSQLQTCHLGHQAQRQRGEGRHHHGRHWNNRRQDHLYPSLSLPKSSLKLLSTDNENDEDPELLYRLVQDDNPTRREFFTSVVVSSLIPALVPSFPNTALAVEPRSTSDAVITDKIFIEFKGIPPASTSSDGSTSSSSGMSSSGTSSTSNGAKDRIVIGLFGNDAPQPVSILKQLVSKPGYKSKCKPLDTSRLLQKEQLEANKVYNACLETEDTLGVTYDLSSVWRIIRDQRIDLGAVSGKYVARENPTFEDTNSGLSHDMPGVVSVRRGNDGGFGFTIYPGTKNGMGAQILDEDNVVVGRIVEGMDVLKRLNEMPVVKSAGVNYMALTGGPNAKNAPSRACRYGGPMYCNENKPLKKVLIEMTGVL